MTCLTPSATLRTHSFGFVRVAFFTSREFQLPEGQLQVQFDISNLGFEMQDLSDFEISDPPQNRYSTVAIMMCDLYDG